MTTELLNPEALAHLQDEGNNGHNAQGISDWFKTAQDICLPLRQGTVISDMEKLVASVDSCSDCGERTGNLIRCSDCRDMVCEKTCSYTCADCAEKVPYCRKCFDAHQQEGHWTDSDSMREKLGIGGAR